MKDHLNIFEYYNQKGILPIENNSTRNLGIVLKNNPLAFFSFLDLISGKQKIQILKPANPEDWFIKLQVQIKNFAKEAEGITNIIGATLTTTDHEFYGEESVSSNVESITDMIIFARGTLIIIEAKRNDIDAREQLMRQITEFKQTWENKWSKNQQTIESDPCTSLTWEEVVDCLNNIDVLTNGKDAILHDYIEHVKKSVPKFFPVQCFAKLTENDSDHIMKRIERFANNYGTEVILRNKSSEPLYWVSLTDKDYVRELILQNYNKDLGMYLYLANTNGQGYSLFNERHGLSILSTSKIAINDYEMSVSIKPKLKISDAWAKWKYDVDVNTLDKNTLKSIFKDVCGKKNSYNNQALMEVISQYGDSISSSAFKTGFHESFKNTDHNYTYIISLTICISVNGLFGIFKEIDFVNTISSENDEIVMFIKNVLEKIYDLIEN